MLFALLICITYFFDLDPNVSGCFRLFQKVSALQLLSAPRFGISPGSSGSGAQAPSACSARLGGDFSSSRSKHQHYPNVS
jgi:hypothetical protein